METESLRLFVLAADKLNISAAGRDLGMAPAKASARLAKLERSLGTDLLHRSTRKVSLSPDGEDFLPHAREMLAHEDAALAALGGASVVTGTLRFAASSTFAQAYIMPILPEFLERHPAVTLDMRLSDTCFDMFEGSFDLALRSAPMADSALKARKLANDNRIMCASPAYLQAHGKPSHPDELTNHRLIAFGNRGYRRLRAKSGATGIFDPVQSESRLIVDDGLSQKLLTLEGAGISINSLWTVHDELRRGTLVRVLPDYWVDDDTVLWLAYPKSSALTAKVRAFMDFLLEKIGKTPPWDL